MLLLMVVSVGTVLDWPSTTDNTMVDRDTQDGKHKHGQVRNTCEYWVHTQQVQNMLASGNHKYHYL